ncbi:hypothetical protein PF004_g12637 [Phytophthora fragariae]|uniref:Uncharacterized protein n=1 Tax=Phytophthora fragariae TaxID=53985 RepID=A0A6G0NUM9_9STRA|nr:hypothetical protein PF004_g12637 [Phytophthora fragariae]
MNTALAANLGSYAGQYSQLYGVSGASTSVPNSSASSADSWPFHDIGAPNDVLVPNGEVCQRLSALLGRVTHQAGEYSFGGEAKTLHVMPGVALKGQEDFIALPLQKDHCESLLKCCKKETEKLWVLPGERVEMRNPEWQAGLDKLVELSAARMGYKGVVMTVVLSKLMVVEQGGGLKLEQDPDENDRCIAKLVVQLPSKCTGGDLVVHQEGTKNQFRYTLGENKGMAAFKPHYVLYTAGAFRAVEEVTSGFSLIVVYSMCLPPELPFVRGSNGSDMLRLELAECITRLNDDLGMMEGEVENERFESVLNENADDTNSRIALVLSRDFQLQDFKTDSLDGQPNVDRDRIDYLGAANAIVPPEKQLKLYVARLQYAIPGSYGRWDQKKAVESATWYTLRGEKLGDSVSTPVNWTTALNFLNPGNETLGQIWKNGDGEFVYRYERFAIVAWPKVVDVKNTQICTGETAAAASVLMDAPVDLARLRMILRYEARQCDQAVVGMPGVSVNAPLNDLYGRAAQEYGSHVTNRSVQLVSKAPVSLVSCRNLCEAISGSNEVLLVEVFFRKYFARLGQKRELVPFLAIIVRKFGWEGVSALFLRAFDGMSCSGCMGLALQLADALINVPSVRITLTIIAVQKACGTSPEELAASCDVELLWKHAIACASPQVFRDVGNLFARLDAKMIGPVVEALSKYVTATDSLEHRALLTTMASRRRQWLMHQVAETKKPFAWEVLDMNFVGAAGMTSFLQGPNTSYQVRCFKGLEEAHRRMVLLQAKIRAPLKMTVGGRGRDAYVLVTKQTGRVTQRSQDIHKFKGEIHQLNRLLAVDSRVTASSTNTTDAVSENSNNNNAAGSNTYERIMVSTSPESSPSAVGTKRPREEPEVIVIE